MKTSNLRRAWIASALAFVLLAAGVQATDSPQPPAKAADVGGQKTAVKEKTSTEKRKEARDSMEAAAKKAGLDMKRVQKFCDELETRQKTYWLKDEHITGAYANVEKLITNQDAKAFCKQDERNKLAEEVLHNLARPTEIDQGYHPTCNVTTFEVYLSARHPDTYADLVAQIAISRKYRTEAGETLDIPEKALLPGVDEKKFDIDHPNQDIRNRASQFVQMTVVNGVYQTGRYKKSGSAFGKDYQYIMGPQTSHTENDPKWGVVTVLDSEDKLVDGQGNAVKDSNGQEVTSPWFTTEEILEGSEMIIGYKMPYIKNPYKIENQPWVYDLPDAARLLKLKKDEKLPCGVPTKGGIHVQTIHDVFVDSQGQCWVLIDNQHGAKDDGWVKLEDLHKSQQDMNYDMTPQHTRPPN